MAAIDRRHALRRLAAGSIGAAASGLWVEPLTALARRQAVHVHVEIAAAAQSATAWTAQALDPHQVQTVSVLSELIIPQTDTPGAKATLVDRFIDRILADAEPADRASFLSGLAWIDARSTTLFGKDVVSASAAQQTDLLTRLSAADSAEAADGVAFFRAIKALTITGYYTSEVGMRQELGDDGVLAQATFEGCTHAEHGG